MLQIFPGVLVEDQRGGPYLCHCRLVFFQCKGKMRDYSDLAIDHGTDKGLIRKDRISTEQLWSFLLIAVNSLDHEMSL